MNFSLIFLWVSVHGGGGCVVAIVDFSWIFFVCVCCCSGGLFDFWCSCCVGGGFFIDFLCCFVFVVVDYLCCRGCFLCCCGVGGLFDFFDFFLCLFVFLWVSCGRGSGDGFF